jgi:acyl carrier protein
MALETTILELITLSLPKKRKKIKLNTPLFTSDDGFDSFGLMEFVLRLEEAFGLTIPDEDLDPDIFFSVETIINYLCRRLVTG